VFANYRNARRHVSVVKRLVGAPFFHAAVDAFVRAHPSTSGDLNVYGDAFASFLEGYAPAAELPYLPDVARLEWAIDESSRAPDHDRAPEAVLAALSAAPPDRLPTLRLALAPSCRLVASNFPIYRIWQVNQPDYVGDDRVSLDEGAVALLLRRDWCAPTRAADAAALPPEADCSARPWGGPAALIGICVERIDAGLHAWLWRWPPGRRSAPRSTLRRTLSRRSISATRCGRTSPRERSQPWSPLRIRCQVAIAPATNRHH
jgi:hypothetical protein